MLLSGPLFLLAALLGVVRSQASADIDTLQGLYDLVARRLPENKNSFKFTIEPNGSADSFVVSDLPREWYDFSGPFIQISGTSISACARGLYTYGIILFSM